MMSDRGPESHTNRTDKNDQRDYLQDLFDKWSKIGRRRRGNRRQVSNAIIRGIRKNYPPIKD